MTREEAKKMLEAKLKCLIAEASGTNYDCNMRLCDGCSLNYEQGNMGEQKQALDMAIKALEQQPCEDAEVIKVSKGTVKARQGRYVIYDVEWLKKHFYTTEEKIYGQPKQPCDDTVSREDAKSFLYERLNRLNNDELYDIFSVIIDDMYNELPSVQPKSRWIPVSERLPEKGGDYLVTIKWKGSYSGDVYTETNMAVYREKEEEWDCAGIIAWMPLPKPYEPTN